MIRLTLTILKTVATSPNTRAAPVFLIEIYRQGQGCVATFKVKAHPSFCRLLFCGSDRGLSPPATLSWAVSFAQLEESRVRFRIKLRGSLFVRRCLLRLAA
jgi:hypothetical protein